MTEAKLLSIDALYRNIIIPKHSLERTLPQRRSEPFAFMPWTTDRCIQLSNLGRSPIELGCGLLYHY